MGLFEAYAASSLGGFYIDVTIGTAGFPMTLAGAPSPIGINDGYGQNFLGLWTLFRTGTKNSSGYAMSAVGALNDRNAVPILFGVQCTTDAWYGAVVPEDYLVSSGTIAARYGTINNPLWSLNPATSGDGMRAGCIEWAAGVVVPIVVTGPENGGLICYPKTGAANLRVQVLSNRMITNQFG